MDETPTQRRFRFRLSTVLVLTAIAAWGMACTPWIVTNIEERWTLSTDPMMSGAGGWKGASVDGKNWLRVREGRHPNLRLVWPTLALVAVTIWKTMSIGLEYRRRKHATTG